MELLAVLLAVCSFCSCEATEHPSALRTQLVSKQVSESTLPKPQSLKDYPCLIGQMFLSFLLVVTSVILLY